MTELDDILLPEIEELIDEVGATVTIYDVTKSGDPTQGRVTETPVGTRTPKASPPAPFKRELIDGDTIREGDVTIILAGKDLGFTPTIGWFCDIGSDKFKILGVHPIYSGASVCAYKLHLRK